MNPKAEFNGRIYPSREIAERQREVFADVTALRLMQAHHKNQFFSFKCVTPAEEQKWRGIAATLVPVVRDVAPWPQSGGDR